MSEHPLDAAYLCKTKRDLPVGVSFAYFILNGYPIIRILARS
jgi:hypothetical protein